MLEDDKEEVVEEQRIIKRRKKRGLSPTHVHCKQKTFWLDKDIDAFLQQITNELQISQNYFINSVLRKFKSGDLTWDQMFKDTV